MVNGQKCPYFTHSLTLKIYEILFFHLLLRGQFEKVIVPFKLDIEVFWKSYRAFWKSDRAFWKSDRAFLHCDRAFWKSYRGFLQCDRAFWTWYRFQLKKAWIFFSKGTISVKKGSNIFLKKARFQFRKKFKKVFSQCLKKTQSDKKGYFRLVPLNGAF